MDQQKEIEQLLVPLEALTLEDLNTMDKISRAMSMKRPLSPTTAFPPIPSDNGGLIRHASCTDCNTEAKSIFTAFKAQSPTQLPQIKVMPEAQEETKQFFDFSSQMNFFQTTDNDETEFQKSSEDLKQEVIFLHKCVRREIENAREIILQARIALLAKERECCVHGGLKCHEQEKCLIDDYKICPASFAMRTVQAESTGIAAVFAKVKKATRKDKKKRRNLKHNLEKSDESARNYIVNGKEMELNGTKTLARSFANVAEPQTSECRDSKQINQTKCFVDETVIRNSKNTAKCTVINLSPENQWYSVNTSEIRDKKNDSPLSTNGEIPSYSFNEDQKYIQYSERNEADISHEKCIDLEKRLQVPKDEMRLINELYKLQCRKEAMRLRAVVESKKRAERELREALAKEKKELEARKKRKEREKKYQQENEISIIRMEAKFREGERIKELEDYYLAKKKFELMKRRQQNLLFCDEDKNLEMASRTTDGYSLSYVPSLPMCGCEQSMVEEIEEFF
mgnify:CR=1 FL=1